MRKNDIPLDEEAKKLFQQLGGIDTRSRVLSEKHAVYRQIEFSEDDEKRLDPFRSLLVDLTYFLTTYLTRVRISEAAPSKNDPFLQFAKTFVRLSQMPALDNSLLIRYRGFSTETGISAQEDYTILFGNLIIDSSSVINMARRMGSTGAYLPKRLNKAFNVLVSYGINTLYIEFPDFDDRHEARKKLEQMRICLNIFARYPLAAKKTSLVFEKGGKQISCPIVSDENGKPDINLTLVGGLNRLTAQGMQSMVERVDSWMHADPKRRHHTDIYNTIFEIRNLREKLIRPPVDINNIKWMITEKVEEEVSIEKSEVTRLVLDKYGESPQKATQVLQSVYGKDYQKINPINFGLRVHLASDLLKSVEKLSDKSVEQELEREVMNNIEGRFSQVREEVFEELELKENILSVRSGEKETVVGKIHDKLLNVISFYKGRAATRMKMRDIVRRPIDFDDQDYEILAREFAISVQEAKELITLLKACFDNEGHFLRSSFERNIPAFARYEKRVFDFLWHYLKETFRRIDRVAFLNSLQLLIGRMEQPKRAIRVLLADFLKDPDFVSFSDRNALMLANLLVRKYNKERNLDIEITPEEVLLVREGMNHEVVKAARFMIEGVEERFIKKISAIRTALLESLRGKKQDMPIRYLFSLEREIYIFLSLLGGETAHTVIKSALKFYGKSSSEAYRLKETINNMSFLLQHLTILVRCIGRVGTEDDLPLLESISWAEEGLLRLSGDNPGHKSKISRIMRWVDSCKESIVRDSWKDNRDSDGFEVMPT